MIEAKAAENGQECLALPGSLRWNARKLLETGDVPAIREIADRLDGKVPQAVVGDDEHDPLRLSLEGLLGRIAANGKRLGEPTE